jgi:hypothetical protein
MSKIVHLAENWQVSLLALRAHDILKITTLRIKCRALGFQVPCARGGKRLITYDVSDGRLQLSTSRDAVQLLLQNFQLLAVLHNCSTQALKVQVPTFLEYCSTVLESVDSLTVLFYCPSRAPVRFYCIVYEIP